MDTGIDEEGLDKGEMKHSLNFSTLGVRVAEMKEAWVKSQHVLVAALSYVEA